MHDLYLCFNGLNTNFSTCETKGQNRLLRGYYSCFAIDYSSIEGNKRICILTIYAQSLIDIKFSSTSFRQLIDMDISVLLYIWADHHQKYTWSVVKLDFKANQEENLSLQSGFFYTSGFKYNHSDHSKVPKRP